MRLLSLKVENFRNLKSDTVSFGNRINILIGKNAQGKTSALEAIYLLAHTRSFREAKIKDVIDWSNSEQRCEIVADVIDNEGLEKRARYTIENKGREFFINENRIVKASDFYGAIKVVEFTPDDIGLVKGEPQRRREFLDKTISLIDKSYLEHLVSYQKAIRSRNVILRDEQGSNSAVWDKLKPWTSLVISHGSYITKRRAEITEELSRASSNFYKKIADESITTDHIALCYKGTYLRNNSMSPEAELLNAYQEAIAKERALKRTTIGPHRDDIFIAHTEPNGEREARSSASQGQSRSIALSLKMSALILIRDKTGDGPILLLDDVESELDTNRVNSLYRIVSDELNAQTFITAVDGAMAKNWFKNDAKTYLIEGGKIEQI